MRSKGGSSRWVVVVASSLAMTGAMTGAMTQPAGAQPAGTQADALFRQGKVLMAAGKLEEACAAFDASQQLDPAVPTLLNQANCRERNGQLATAWGLFLEVERQTRAFSDLASQQMHKTATDRAARLEPRLSTLRIQVPADSRIDGLEILRNGDVLEPATWNQALPIDGGTYTIVARAPGDARWSSTVVVAAEHDARTLDVPNLHAAKLVAAPVAAPVGEAAPVVRAPAPGTEAAPVIHAPPRGPPAAGSPTSPPTSSPTGSMWSGKRKLAVGVAGGGVLALAVGGVLGVSATHRQHDAQALCPDRRLGCDDAPRANELLRSGHDRATFANVAFGVGAAAVIAAGALWFTGAPEAPGRVAVLPAASPGQVVVVASGSF